ncbi:MAG TPA: CDP-alcohol phosphatidyltransferase family protein [Chthoniobacterales bacterium]|nr:CDP-alcohol phosphatidyltransferase family protein [Chthoniobacterales bacterium]
MSESVLAWLVIVVEGPDALTELCGVSLLERMRRSARQIGFGEATVLSNCVEVVRKHLGRQSWRRTDLSLEYRQVQSAAVTVKDVLTCRSHITYRPDTRVLIWFANFCCDPRLLRDLVKAARDTALLDLDPPQMVAPLWQNAAASRVCAAVVSPEWLSTSDSAADLHATLDLAASNGRLALLDAAQQDGYLSSMRRAVRPLVFPAPSPTLRPLAERLLLDETQKGVLDFPALVHAPIEKWLVSHLCRTTVTPNQITLLVALLGLAVTFFYSSGYLWVGTLLALAIGILDGVDGKLARLKIQTTKVGRIEHTLDLFIEMSWWAALAYYFHSTGQLPYAYAVLTSFYLFYFLARLARGFIQRRIGRSLDDFAPFDRLVRYVAGRRNIYAWLFTLSLLMGAPATGFVLLCSWGIVSAMIHIYRSVQIAISREQATGPAS